MKKRTAKNLFTVLIILNLALIWGNSLMDGTDSGALSGGIVAWLGQFFPFFATEAGHTFLRKAAHFSEFCLLGILTGARRIASERAPSITLTGFGLAAACIDETIQIYVPGRASSLIDVWIDSAGFATGMILVIVGHSIRNKHNHDN